jgi:hypothetical protein
MSLFFEGESRGENGMKPFVPSDIAAENAELERKAVEEEMKRVNGINPPPPPKPGIAASNLPPVDIDSALVKGPSTTTATRTPSREMNKPVKR